MVIQVLGIIAVASSYVLYGIGLPKQIIKVYKIKRCDGLAPEFLWFNFVNYLCWAIYGWVKGEMFVLASAGPGAILTSVLVGQFYYYAWKNKRKAMIEHGIVVDA